MSDFEDLIRAHLDPRVMAADAIPEVVFVGGPEDGQRSYQHAPLKDEMRVPVVRGLAALTAWDATTDPPTVIPQPCHRYSLIYVDGQPSRDDVGAYRFEYVETVES